MKKKWKTPTMSFIPIDTTRLGDVSQMSDAELKIKLQQAGYRFEETYQASKDYIYRKIGDSDVLISIGSNIADFNGYIELNQSALTLWETLQYPCRLNDLEEVLEKKFAITHEKAVEDVLDFIKELKEYDMVVIQ